jgi:ferric-dicitrate binding protein FerR (iron transport regulator)
VSTEKAERLERARQLMMAALDDELASGEREELDRLLAEEPALRSEWDRFHEVKEVTDVMSLRRPPEETWEQYFESVYNRAERGFALILRSMCAIVLTGWALWVGLEELWGTSDLPTYVKIAIYAALLGLAVLLLSVIREKLFVRKTDPYKEIQR